MWVRAKSKRSIHSKKKNERVEKREERKTQRAQHDDMAGQEIDCKLKQPYITRKKRT